uniref:Uncharacterized protein n=1 Tax=Arundo donax TaxID=35708 RepID=A0A0A9GIN4_ARUDO
MNWYTLDQYLCVFSFPFFLASTLAIVMIANGTPPHFLKIFSDTLANSLGGHLSSVPYILRLNNFLESSTERGFRL